MDSRITLGRITGIHGLKGWVKVHSDTSPRENIVRYSPWWLGQHGQWKAIKVIEGRPQGKTIIARLEGFDTPESAGLLTGAEIAIDRDVLPAAAGDEYYWADLIGMQVRRVEGVHLGTVLRLFETGANDVLVVADEREGAKPRSEVLVPWVMSDVVVEVNGQENQITVDWDPDY